MTVYPRVVYVNGTWNGFDVLFSTSSISGIKCILKFCSFNIWGLSGSPVMGNISFKYFSCCLLHSEFNSVCLDRWALEMGMDFLAIAACLIFPR